MKTNIQKKSIFEKSPFSKKKHTFRKNFHFRKKRIFETQKALSYVVTVLDDNKNQVFSDFKFPSFDSMDIGDLFPNTEYTIIVFYHFLSFF